jgi:uncharacterized tellurite resistance protein B-like protein
MGSPDLFKALTRSLRGGKARALAPEDIRLTPYLAVVVAILYMMAADGDISDRESSQLQSVIGADTECLHRAVAYAETRSVEQFLKDAPSLLDAKARLCLLMNVCDSLMADGELSSTELQLFDQLVAALGHTKASFQPYFDAIVLKGRLSVLGDFDAAAANEELTPPKALVVSLLYMMSADGSMEDEEIGRLNAVVGGSQALLKACLRYVGKVRAPQFLAAAAGVLDEQQRLCILLNACDTMMSDHEVASGERDLFRRMLTAFDIAPGSFDRYLNVVFLKNDLPKDDRRPAAAKEQVAHPQARGKSRSEGVVFERKREWQEQGGEAGDADPDQRRKPGQASKKDASASELDHRISRTMQENIDRMSGEFGGKDGFDNVAANSRGGANAGEGGVADEGATDLRAFRESGFSEDKGHVVESGHAGEGRHWKDADGASDKRSQRDADGQGKGARDAQRNGASVAGKHWKDAEGAADGRALRDADGPQTAGDAQRNGANVAGKHWKDTDGAADGRPLRDADGPQLAADAQRNGLSVAGKHWKDADGAADGRALQDAAGAASSAGLIDAAGIRPGHAWRDANGPGDSQAMRDADAPASGKHLIDERRSFDAASAEDSDAPAPDDPISGRMGNVSDRTKTIQAHLEAMRSSRSIMAANRLPRLPAGPAVQRRLPAAAVAAEVASGDATVQLMPAAESAGNVVEVMEIDDASQMLLASDEGGPILSVNTTPPGPEQAQQHRKLRQLSAVLLPALFVTYGSTMVGETSAERTFITSENMATDARVVHQMTSVQQTVYRVVPDAVTLAAPSVLSPLSAGSAATAAGTSSAAGIAPSTASAAAATVAGTSAAATAATTAAANAATLAAGAATAAGATAIKIASSDAPSPAGAGESAVLTDREKADNFLEQRKQELQTTFERQHWASMLAAERKQWFVYAKSIVLLGLGMAFWGVLFRSMRMLHSSTVAGLIGMLLTANGYWLFLRF